MFEGLIKVTHVGKVPITVRVIVWLVDTAILALAGYGLWRLVAG